MTHRLAVFAATMAVLLFVLGTVGFHHLLHESWNASFYRTAITATLTGLDTAPRGVGVPTEHQASPKRAAGPSRSRPRRCCLTTRSKGDNGWDPSGPGPSKNRHRKR